MRKLLVIAIPIVTLAFFILVMNSDNIFKYSLGKDNNIPQSIEKLTQYIQNEKWEEASNQTEKLSDSWKKVVKKVQFSAEKDEINAFNVNIARLRGAIMAKDKLNSFMELTEAYEHWENIGS